MRKKKSKLKKVFNSYNIAIFACLVIIVISGIVLFEPFKGIKLTKDDVIAANVSEDGNVSEKEARKTAVKQFKELGESSVKSEDLQVLKIQRDGEEYYYVTSKENTMEIKLTSGDVTMLNSQKVSK